MEYQINKPLVDEENKKGLRIMYLVYEQDYEDVTHIAIYDDEDKARELIKNLGCRGTIEEIPYNINPNGPFYYNGYGYNDQKTLLTGSVLPYGSKIDYVYARKYGENTTWYVRDIRAHSIREAEDILEKLKLTCDTEIVVPDKWIRSNFSVSG